MKDYTPKISKENLEHGAYYSGQCRNASVARWNDETQVFIYWRTKFNNTYLEEIKHPDDDKFFDVFVVEDKIENPEQEIPLEL